MDVHNTGQARSPWTYTTQDRRGHHGRRAACTQLQTKYALPGRASLTMYPLHGAATWQTITT